MLNTFNPKKNPAFEFCEAEYFLAYKGEEIVGRVAAIINHRANDTWNKKEVRFGWLDFIDEEEVSSALLKAVEQWGKEKRYGSHCRSVGIYGYGCRRNAG